MLLAGFPVHIRTCFFLWHHLPVFDFYGLERRVLGTTLNTCVIMSKVTIYVTKLFPQKPAPISHSFSCVIMSKVTIYMTILFPQKPAPISHSFSCDVAVIHSISGVV